MHTSLNVQSQLTEANKHFSTFPFLLQLILSHQLLVVLHSSKLHYLGSGQINAVVEVTEEKKMMELVGQVKCADLASLFEAAKAL